MYSEPRLMFSKDDKKVQAATPDDTEHIDPADFKRMQYNLKRFSQCMSLGKY